MFDDPGAMPNACAVSSLHSTSRPRPPSTMWLVVGGGAAAEGGAVFDSDVEVFDSNEADSAVNADSIVNAGGSADGASAVLESAIGRGDGVCSARRRLSLV